LSDLDREQDDDSIPGHPGSGGTNREKLVDADYVTGAFFATRFSLFKAAGGFDRGYRPVYFEELDYCLKLKEAGWRIVSNPGARCRHFEGASVKKFSPRFYRYYHKNRIRCAVINLDIPEFIRFFIPAELKWLIHSATRDQTRPILYAYFMNKLLLLYNLGIKIKNYFILNRIELK
ncbi:MAG: glycosyltransferase, partial [Actinobacteria bacterium]|nr:glycosyltransferase [Actinomycetota bacterium]